MEENLLDSPALTLGFFLLTTDFVFAMRKMHVHTQLLKKRVAAISRRVLRDTAIKCLTSLVSASRTTRRGSREHFDGIPGPLGPAARPSTHSSGIAGGDGSLGG